MSLMALTLSATMPRVKRLEAASKSAPFDFTGIHTPGLCSVSRDHRQQATRDCIFNRTYCMYYRITRKR